MTLDIEEKEVNIEFQIDEFPPKNENRTSNPVPQPKRVIKKSNLQLFFELFEGIVFDYLPFGTVVLLNMVNFGCYIFCSFMFLFWLISIVLFNKIKIINTNGFSKSELVHYIFIIFLFINYFVNDQSNI